MLNRKIEKADPSGIPRAFGSARRLLSLLLSLVLIFGLLPPPVSADWVEALSLESKLGHDKWTGAADRGRIFKALIEEGEYTVFYMDYVNNSSSGTAFALPDTVVIDHDVVLYVQNPYKMYVLNEKAESLFQIKKGGSLTILVKDDTAIKADTWVGSLSSSYYYGEDNTRFTVVESGGTFRLGRDIMLDGYGSSSVNGGAILVKSGGKAIISSDDYDPKGISDCDPDKYDYINDGSIDYINAAMFRYCIADKGGAIYVENGGTLEMNGAVFSGDIATKGRHIYLEESASLNMNGEYQILGFDNEQGSAKEHIYTDGDASRQITYGSDMSVKEGLSKYDERKLVVTSAIKYTDEGSGTEKPDAGGSGTEKPDAGGSGGGTDSSPIDTKYERTDTGKVVTEETYLLRVGTGGNPGNSVLCFGIRYEDTKGILHTQYIYPQEGDADDIFSMPGMLEKVDTFNGRINRLKGLSGYTITGRKNGFAANGSGTSLQTWSTDNYLFKPLHPFNKLVCIDVCMFYDQKNPKTQSWECTEMSFFKVDDIRDMNMAGYLSKDVQLLFSGDLLAQMGEKNDGKVVTKPILFHIAKGDKIRKTGSRTVPMVYFEDGHTVDEEKSNTYLFEIDIADVYGAGIEALAADCGAGGLRSTVEALTLDVWYRDSGGNNREVKIPVITSSLVWAVENGYLTDDLPITGIAQQGEHLFFKGYFPNFEEFTSFKLFYGSGAAEKAGMEQEYPNERQKSRLAELKDDKFYLDSFKIYSGDTQVTRDSSSPASLQLTVDENAKPLYQYMSESYLGTLISESEEKNEIIVSKGEASSRDNSALSDLYIVSITTDDVDMATTTDDVSISLQYRSMDGSLNTTNAYSLKDGARDSYGYWPGKGEDNPAYRYAMGRGKKLEFVVSISEVSAFVGATLTIRSSGTGVKIDDWQMSELSVWKYSEPGARRAHWADNLSYTDRYFERDINHNSGDLCGKYPNEIDKKEAEEGGTRPVVYLCTDTPSVTISFNNAGKSIIEENEERDWEALRYSMTFAEAHQDLRFKMPMCEYTVNVQVANNSNDASGNGDAGSSDLFYFSLDFKNGSSAYVLANQLLEADGFRSGVTESFGVMTNRDFGPLVSVHIIPEHSTDDNKFDKLNIKKITVTKKSNEGIAKMWTIDNVGWIGSDYIDEGAESSIGGRPGRSENELAQVFNVTREGYVANILFTMKTGAYKGANKQLTGAITGVVEYFDANGEYNTYDFDVVEKMYEYAGIRKETWDLTGLGSGFGKLDPSFMVRGGKTDRFILAIENLREVIQVTFHVYGKESTEWTLEDLAMYTIDSTGLLQINVDGEYQRNNKVTLLANGKTNGRTVNILAPEDSSSLGDEQEIEIEMGEHRIEVDMKESTWSSTISREPQSNDDSLNVYVYTKTPIPSSNMSFYQMDMAVSCTTPNDGIYQASETGVTPVADGTMFCALSIPARGIKGVNSLYLSASAQGDLVALDRAVVQHVRSGVTINTYTFTLNGNTAAQKQSFTPSASSAGVSRQEKQVVKLLFAEDTEEQVLEKEINDIVVAIRYSSTNDAQRTGQQTNGGGVLYNSKYIYLSDLNQDGAKSQKYTKIKPGMIAEIEFNEAYVGDIVGISLASIGSLRAHIQSACIQSENTVNGKTETQWYNFADDIYVDNAPQIMNKSTRETVVPVRMTFNTEEGAINIGSNAGLGDIVPIRMEVFYHNNLANTIDSTTIEDLNTYLTDGGFKSGETATVEFFLKNTDSIRYIALEPHSIYSSSAAWKLKSVDCETWTNGVLKTYRTKTVNQEILQDNPVRVNLSTVITTIEISMYSDALKDDVRSGKINSGADNPVLTAALKSGRKLTIYPEVDGTLDGYGYKVVAVRGESAFGGEEVTCYHITSDRTQVVFTPPMEETTVSYAIRIASQEMPDSYCDVIVTVEGALKVEKYEDRAPVNSPGTGKEKADDSEDADNSGDGTGGSSDDTPPEA